MASIGGLIQRHGYATLLGGANMSPEWPRCYGYMRGIDPSEHEIRTYRRNMVEFCQSNNLYLHRMFHDLDTPPSVDPEDPQPESFGEFLGHLSESTTQVALLADLEIERQPSDMLLIMQLTLTKMYPYLKVVCMLPPGVYFGVTGQNN